MNEDTKDNIQFVLFLVSCFIGLFLVVGYGVYFFNKYDCKKLSDNTGLETKFRMFGGRCLVKQEKGWIPYEILRDFKN